MSTGRSAAERDAKKQRQLLEQQRQETQKALAEEKDLESRQRRALLKTQKGRGGLLAQQENLKSLLGSGPSRQGSGGDFIGGNVESGGGAMFIDPSSPGTVVSKKVARDRVRESLKAVV